MTSLHTYHIPVMGTAFTAETSRLPLAPRVARAELSESRAVSSLDIAVFAFSTREFVMIIIHAVNGLEGRSSGRQDHWL